jgi:hypothetical protein
MVALNLELMENWEIDFHWVQVRHKLKDLFSCDKLPDLNAVLLMIGIQELGYKPTPLSKEVKQDLMHIAVCTLLSQEGFYLPDGHDSEGWPHFKPVQRIDIVGEKAQESLLIRCAVQYFQAHFSIEKSTLA